MSDLDQSISAENDRTLKAALTTLEQVVESTATPRNVKKIVKDAINLLNDHRVFIGVRSASSISLLEELSQDPNMPSFIRVSIWSALSALESIREP